MTEYTFSDAKQFLEVARENCRPSNLHLSFAIYLSHIAKGIFERYNQIDFIEESEAVMERAREKIKRDYRVKLFNEISAYENEITRKKMEQIFFQKGEVLVTEYMREHFLEDERYLELVDFCLGDESDLEATITAHKLFLGERTAA